MPETGRHEIDPRVVMLSRPGGVDDTPAHHLRRVLGAVLRDLPAKYQGGQAQHGGTLSRKPVVAEIVAEALDLVVYGYTLSEQAGRVLELLEAGLAVRDWSLVEQARNVARCGNAEGES